MVLAKREISTFEAKAEQQSRRWGEAYSKTRDGGLGERVGVFASQMEGVNTRPRRKEVEATKGLRAAMDEAPSKMIWRASQRLGLRIVCLHTANAEVALRMGGFLPLSAA